MARKVTKRAQLLRVFHSPQAQGKTLQAYIEEAVPSSLDLDLTEIVSAQFGAIRLNESPTASAQGGLKLKIVGHAPGEMATTVPVKLKGARKNEGAIKAPVQDSFKNGDFFLIVKDDEILGFGDHMRAESMIRYLRQLLTGLLNNPVHAAMWTTNVFAYDAAQQLGREGIRALKFDASLSAATADTVDNPGFRGPVKKLTHAFFRTFDSIIKEEVDANELADVHVAISISVANGIHGSDLANSAVAQAAETMLKDEVEAPQDGVIASIETKQGNRISIAEATVGKNYRLSRRTNENSLVDLEAWEALEDFHCHVVALGEMKT